jgi:alkylation response protein AidB-like acyl-CoA dehydrogenase
MGSLAFVSGVLMNIFELVGDFCAKRTFRGKPLKENDDVAGVLSDLAAATEAIRVMGYQYARMVDRPDLYGHRWSEAMVAKGRAFKYFAADKGIKAVEDVMNVTGLYGVDREVDMEKHWRDLKIVQLWMGGKQLCQMEVARYFYGCETL